MPIVQLDEDTRQNVAKFAFSIANGNHIMRYSEEDYRQHLAANPQQMVKLFTLFLHTDNFDESDKRNYDNYTEQWLAKECDTAFKTELVFKKEYFSTTNLQPWQQSVIEYTEKICGTDCGLQDMLDSGSPLEMCYGVLMNRLQVNEAG